MKFLRTIVYASFASSLLMLSGCAGSARHDVLADYEANDVNLSCEELAVEKGKAQDVLDEVEKDREAIDGRDLTDGILWFPFNLIAKSSNYKDATAAASARIERLEALEKDKSCA